MTAENRTASAAAPATPYLLEIIRSDPFARLLQKTHQTPISLGLIALTYSLLRTIALPALFGHLTTVEVNGQLILGMLDDWTVLVNELITVPVVAAYYLWQPSAMQALYDGISEKIGPSPLARARAMEFVRPLRWPGWALAAILVGLLEASFILYVFLNSTTIIWETVNGVMLASSFVVRFFTFYMLVYVILRQTYTIIGLNRLFAELTVKIAPLHPDKAGGLRILGDYVLSTSLIIGAVGLYFGMNFIRQELNPFVITAEFYALLALYFVLAPLFFFLPLIQVHRRMKEAKGRLLTEVADQFDIEYRKLLEGLKQDRLDSTHILRVEAIQKIYKIAEDAPEWPFNVEIVSKYAAAIVFPVLLPGVAQIFGEWFFR